MNEIGTASKEIDIRYRLNIVEERITKAIELTGQLKDRLSYVMAQEGEVVPEPPSRLKEPNSISVPLSIRLNEFQEKLLALCKAQEEILNRLGL